MENSTGAPLEGDLKASSLSVSQGRGEPFLDHPLMECALWAHNSLTPSAPQRGERIYGKRMQAMRFYPSFADKELSNFACSFCQGSPLLTSLRSLKGRFAPLTAQAALLKGRCRRRRDVEAPVSPEGCC